MSLLREIQDAAVSSDTKATDLLRKCKILAVRLSSRDFEQWINSELSGYESKEQTPDYRILKHVEIKGHFYGPFGSGLRNAIIPPSCLDKDIAKMMTTEYLMSGIGVYEALLTNGTDGVFHGIIPTDIIVHYFGENIYEDMNCMEAWKDIPRGAIVGLIDEVRNRILSFSLEIEKMNPDAGEAPVNSEPIPQQSVNQVFHTHIFGDVGSLVTDNKNSYSMVNLNLKGNLQGLKKELAELGISESDILSLEKAIYEDEKIENGQVGKKTTSWLSKMLSKAAKGVFKITVATATEVLPKLISGYFGL